LDGSTGVCALLSADESVGGFHGNGADGVFSQVLGDFEDEAIAAGFDFEGVEDLGEFFVKLREEGGAKMVRCDTKNKKTRIQLGPMTAAASSPSSAPHNPPFR
jgi:hypothetical protein